MKLPEAGLLAKILIYHCQAGSLADPVMTNFFHKVVITNISSFDVNVHS